MNKEIVNARKQNMRLFSIYRAISLDLIFYYGVEFLFLTQVKNITASKVVLASSFYAIYMIFLQIPASIIVDKLGTKKCSILANIFNVIFVFLIINCSGFYMLIFAQFISALCYSLKDISDEALLRYSIPDAKIKGDIFSKLEGRGNKNYFLFNGVSSIFSGFLYVINQYIPMIISLVFAILATILSFGFQDIERIKVDKKEQTIKQYFIELKEGMSFILKSKRLRSLFLYSGISWGTFCLISKYRSSLLVDIGTGAQIMTIVSAILNVASSLGSKRQLEFNKKFKNKSLSIILILVTISILISGIIGLLNVPYIIALSVIIICFVVINAVKGMSLVLTTRYLGNFSDEKILTQIYAANAMMKNLLRAIIAFLGYRLLDTTSTANSMIVVGICLSAISISLIIYMKNRLGLNPDDYDKDEIYNKGDVEVKL